MARNPRPTGQTPVEAFTHDEKRTNIPTADAAAEWIDEDDLVREPVVYKRFAGFAAERAARGEELDPQLVWRGKDQLDQSDLVVDAPPIYIQEKLDPRVLIENLRKTAEVGAAEPELTLFDQFDGLDELDQIEFYKHDANWSNRMILGDSLQVMGSLAEREGLRGKVQMIYIDPPYGIKFGSNWQVSARKRDVKDGKVEDAAREAEQIKAFRDTWEDGIHTYLSYLRDRLVVARDLLTETGSVFVQIGDENVHLVRSLLDEVFGSENFVSEISYRTTTGATSDFIAGTVDFVLWFARDREAAKAKYRALYRRRLASADPNYRSIEEAGDDRVLAKDEMADKDSLVASGARLFRQNPITSQSGGETTQFPVQIDGRTFVPGKGGWKTSEAGMERLRAARRLLFSGRTLGFKRYFDDFPLEAFSNVWDDTRQSGFGEEKSYVVQTATKVIERCMLMTTDPGDLVLDPTMGSGTTAYVAEQWGRRWITIDTSRVALALARQRLMGGKYPYFLLADSDEGRKQEGIASGTLLPPTQTRGDIRQGFVYERVQHITLKSIANNPDIHEGMTRDEIDAAIKRHAEFELLYDKPYEDRKRVRVTGPFTVESLSPYRSLSFGEADGSIESDVTEGPEFTQTILDSLRASGIQNGRRNERIEFASLEPYAGIHVQAMGDRAAEDDASVSHVAIAIGPQYGTVSPGFIKEAAREALKDPEVDLLCVLGFAFDPQATGVTEADGVTLDTGDAGFANVEGERKLGRIKVLLVRMNAELLMGDALKKTGAGNLFTVFGEPDIGIRDTPGSTDFGLREVELHGVDVYDPVSGTVRSRQTDRVALWMIDTDYNDESFFVRHCYFTGGNDPYKKLKVALKADIDADAWGALYRTVSLPFEFPSTGKIAVKVINDYGDEVMKVYDLRDSGPPSD
ncbi:MAG: site-specific DNA-methyltransferase [Microbacterium sp.]|nr:MAG: site-specific DNA-methyltransferase [Microbacterium sp.]